METAVVHDGVNFFGSSVVSVGKKLTKSRKMLIKKGKPESGDPAFPAAWNLHKLRNNPCYLTSTVQLTGSTLIFPLADESSVVPAVSLLMQTFQSPEGRLISSDF